MRSRKRVPSPQRDELPSFAVFIVAPVLGLGIWIGLALLVFL